MNIQIETVKSTTETVITTVVSHKSVMKRTSDVGVTFSSVTNESVEVRSIVAQSSPAGMPDINAGNHTVNVGDFDNVSQIKDYIKTLPSTEAGYMDAIRLSIVAPVAAHPTEVSRLAVIDDNPQGGMATLIRNGNIRDNSNIEAGISYRGADDEVYKFEAHRIIEAQGFMNTTLKHLNDCDVILANGLTIRNYSSEDRDDSRSELIGNYTSVVGGDYDIMCEYINAHDDDVIATIESALSLKIRAAYN